MISVKMYRNSGIKKLYSKKSGIPMPSMGEGGADFIWNKPMMLWSLAETNARCLLLDFFSEENSVPDGV